MNTKLFEQVKAMIRQEADHFDMRDWFKPGNDLGYATTCKTTACIAGFACIANYKGKETEFPLIVKDLCQQSNFASIAKELLDITDEEMDQLFYAHHWPDPFRDEYIKAQKGCARTDYLPDYKQMAEVACRRIDFFLKEGL